ncbi:MAG: GspE/PulE family protein [Victivallaceae bacterium]|nr:GspE/PulE family protein [Victivallaceae bacterium]
MQGTFEERLQEIARRLGTRAEYPTRPSRASDQLLVESGKISDGELAKLFAEIFEVGCVDEEEFTPVGRFDPGMLEFCSTHCCFVSGEREDSVEMLLADPYDIGAIAMQLEALKHKKLTFLFARKVFIERLLSKIQSLGDDASNSADSEEDLLRSLAGEAKIVRLVNDIFTRAIELGASDIHIEPGEEVVSVRCRVDGVLTEILSAPLGQFPAISSRIKLIGNLNIAESRLPQDGRTNVTLNGQTIDMRISTIPILTGESIVLRLLNQESVTFDLTTLGMDQAHLELFRRLIAIPHGMILVVGPTGSGKTTTLYSVISQLNDSRKKIITIEDPVEYKMQGLCQMQINHKIGVTFANGLRSIVRQDPDIILVGEIRDRETADIAINAALTGHLVLSTLHTNDAVGAVTRLLDMGVENFLVSSALAGVLSQRLVRKLCPECHGKGSHADQSRCRKCNGSGFKGRCGIFELLIMNDELRDAVNRSVSSSVLEEIAVRHGMTTLLDDGRKKVAAGVTTEEELNRSAAEM